MPVPTNRPSSDPKSLATHVGALLDALAGDDMKAFMSAHYGLRTAINGYCLNCVWLRQSPEGQQMIRDLTEADGAAFQIYRSWHFSGGDTRAVWAVAKTAVEELLERRLEALMVAERRAVA